MAKELGIKDLKKYSGSSDKGEVKIKEIQKMLPWKFVKIVTGIPENHEKPLGNQHSRWYLGTI